MINRLRRSITDRIIPVRRNWPHLSMMIGILMCTYAAYRNAGITVAVWMFASGLTLLVCALLVGMTAWNLRIARVQREEIDADRVQLLDLKSTTLVVTDKDGQQTRMDLLYLAATMTSIEMRWIEPISVALVKAD